MEIKTLKFKNINSLKGEHQIDFSDKRFRQNPLFAITGPTGSGKTTILDVISLALFNQVPRLGKLSKGEVENKGAILTRNQEEAYAQVTYTCQSGTFSSVWSIGTTRNGNLRDYEMELTRVDIPEAMDLKKSEVPRKNEELIGLSYEQFIKSVVLAQGEFAKFLKANKKERSQLLEQITGTGIYRKLGLLAFETFKTKNEAIKDEIKLVESDKTHLIPEAEEKDLKQRLKTHKTAVQKIEQQLEAVKKECGLHEQIAQIQTAQQQNQQVLTRTRQEEEEFAKTHGKRLQAHETLQEFVVDLQRWNDKTKEITTLDADLKNRETQYKNAQVAQQNLQKSIRDFVRAEQPIAQPLEALHRFGVRVNNLKEERKTLRQAYETQRELFAREIKNVDSKIDSAKLLIDEKVWQALKKTYQDKETEWNVYFSEGFPQDIQQRIVEKTQQIEHLRTGREGWQEVNRKVEEGKKAKTEAEKLNTLIQDLPEEVEQLKTREEQLTLQVENYKLKREKAVLQKRLEDYRHELKSGEACPLCGSLEHPYAQHLPKLEDDVKSRLQILEKDLKAVSNQLARKTSQLELQGKRLVEINTHITDLRTAYKTTKNNFTGQFSEAQLQWNLEQWNAALVKAQTQLQQLQAYQEFTKCLIHFKEALPIYDKAQGVLQNGQEKKNAIDQLYSGTDFEADLHQHEENWRQNQQHLQQLATQLEQEKLRKEEVIKVQEALVVELLPQVKAKGFDDLKTAQSAILPAEDHRQLHKKAEALKVELQRVNAAQATYQTQLEALLRKLETDKTLETLQLEKEDLMQCEKGLRDEIQEEERRLKNQRELLERIRLREESIKVTRQENWRWEQLNKLIGDAKGDTFNQFAQDMTLRHLLKLANTRLKDLSDRYRLKIDTDKNKGNLVVADLDMGGQERSVETLSGGETFLMSLSLALALSDLASQNISINSLFIDEGFGTLDPDTLDQTLDTLERLQASSAKTIGIISHVESLKERIGLQIQLERNGHGYSRLSIVEA